MKQIIAKLAEKYNEKDEFSYTLEKKFRIPPNEKCDFDFENQNKAKNACLILLPHD